MTITLKAARVNANMTQHEAANRLGINKVTLSRYENFKTVPTVDVAKKLASLYETDVNDIIFF